MRLELTGRNVEITPALRAVVDRKLAKLTRVLNDAIVSAQIVLTQEKYRHVTDLSLHMRGDHVLAGKTAGENWTDSIGRATEKVAQQATRVKGKWAERKRRATSARAMQPPPPDAQPDDAVAPRIVRALRYHVRPLAIDDAAMEVEAGSDGFLVFRNADTGAINVLYRRKNGDLGLIEPER
jgi:putative sigma-54 modulation protein